MFLGIPQPEERAFYLVLGPLEAVQAGSQLPVEVQSHQVTQISSLFPPFQVGSRPQADKQQEMTAVPLQVRQFRASRLEPATEHCGLSKWS